MKQFNIVWYPLVGIPLMIMWILKGEFIPMFIGEFIFWALYQTVLITLLIEVIK